MNHSEHKAAAEKRFSDSISAKKWTDMYASETEHLDETNFRDRRDKAVEYVTSILPENGRVLDVGCGAAPVVSELRKRDVSCVGLEYAEDMLTHAKERLRSMSLDDGDLYRGDCCAMPFDGDSFDVVVCLGVISYVEDYARVFDEIRRVLKPGGYMLFSFRNKHNLTLSDPVLLAKTVVKAIVGRRRPEEYVIGRFMDHRDVQRNLANTEFRFRGFFGIGFGPFRLNGRKLFSEPVSIRISRFFAKVFSKVRWTAAVRWLCDVSLWVYVREPERD